ncbi:OLC1v1002856C1 [Oldenlandia corymbosa var. corymbosa]|uniref:OLC1v1002856C1 n=1 Tax=Oldenlandia corymbosa var. corymbosa TaxID=529605 RepID=A0AAV1D8W5_OLDCO|nr:OLC1v1002856C1 [Oldenlandia corymbosa var. corymbosa]
MQSSMSFDMERSYDNSKFDDDGRAKRTGTLTTATAHIITAVIGSGVLSLAWATAQLGWIAGPVALLAFSVITWFTSILLADCYRSPDSVTGRRNYTYMEVVRANLGGRKFQLCGLAQYGNLVGITIGYTITSSISMVAVKRSNCFHNHHIRDGCHTSNNPFIIVFGVVQILLSQIPNFHELSILSIIAAVMSFAYSFIGLGLSIVQIAGAHPETSLTGIPVGKEVTGLDKMWRTFSALGNIAFAYAFSTVLVEIQDTLKPNPPEKTVMKKASSIAIAITTIFYTLCGMLGYAAFGNNAPGNLLTGFGFYEPFWLVDLANVAIVVHLVGAYQVFAQPLFGFVEEQIKNKWPESKFINKELFINLPSGGIVTVSFFRLIWRTAYVVFTTVIAMIFPNFNDVVGLLGAASFFPLTVFFPIEMYIAQTKMRKFSFTWTWLQILSFACLIITLLAAAGSIQGLIKNLDTFKPFKSES